MMVISFSIFSDRRSFKIENGNNNMKTLVRKLVEALPPVISGRPKAALLYCLPLVVLSWFVLLLLLCLLWNASIVTTCPTITAVRYAFCLRFNRFVVCSCFVWRTKAESRARIGRSQTGSSTPLPSNFIAGRPKAALLFSFLLFLLNIKIENREK